MAKTYAWMNATKISMKYINIVNGIENNDVPQPAYVFNPAKMKISDMRHIIIMCPATMFAKRRMINAMGLINTLRNSTGTRMSFTPIGIPGGLNICPQ